MTGDISEPDPVEATVMMRTIDARELDYCSLSRSMTLVSDLEDINCDCEIDTARQQINHTDMRLGAVYTTVSDYVVVVYPRTHFIAIRLRNIAPPTYQNYLGLPVCTQL